MAEPAARRVYIVDDDRAVLDSMRFLLTTLGYECATFAEPARFLGEAPALPPGCVLTDLRMPAMDGFELAAALRGAQPGWPVLMMTSDNGPDLQRRALGHGLAALLHKPVDADLLADALADAFATLEA